MKHKGIWVVVSILLVLGLVLGGVGCGEEPAEEAPPVVPVAPAEPEVIEWTMAACMADSPPLSYYAGPYSDYDYMLHSLMDREFVQWLDIMTGGRLQVTIVEPNSVFPTTESIENIGQGVVEMGHLAQGWLTGSIPECNIGMGLPMAWSTPDVAFDCYNNFGFEEVLRPLYEEHNVWVEFIPTNEIMGFITTFDATSPETIKGKKIRVWGAYGKLVEAMGGLPVAMAYGDVYMGLKLGTVDGSTTGALALENAKLKEVATGMTISPRTNNPVNAILINMDAFNALPDDIKAILNEEVKHYMYALGATEGMQNQLGLAAAVKEYGVKTWQWSGEDEAMLRQLAKDEVWPYYGGLSATSQKLLDIMIEHMEVLGLL